MRVRPQSDALCSSLHSVLKSPQAKANQKWNIYINSLCPAGPVGWCDWRRRILITEFRRVRGQLKDVDNPVSDFFVIMECGGNAPSKAILGDAPVSTEFHASAMASGIQLIAKIRGDIITSSKPLQKLFF